MRGRPHAVDVPYPASNQVSHPVPYPLAGCDRATACGRTLVKWHAALDDITLASKLHAPILTKTKASFLSHVLSTFRRRCVSLLVLNAYPTHTCVIIFMAGKKAGISMADLASGISEQLKKSIGVQEPLCPSACSRVPAELTSTLWVLIHDTLRALSSIRGT